MMTKKLILFDIDDTIIDHSTERSSIPEATKEAICRLKAKGHIVGIATGRSYAHIHHVMKVLGLNAAIAYGGHLVVVDGEVIFEKTLPIKETMRFIREHFIGISPMIAFNERHIYIKDFLGKVKKRMYLEENTLEGETLVSDITTVRKLDIKKREYFGLMIFAKKIRFKNTYKELDFNPWGNHGYEVYAKGISKYSGICHLAEHFGIHLDHVYAFGDSYNDIHMLTHVKNSVAVGNAVEEVKAVASYVCPHIKDGGILTACYELGLLEEKDE